MSPPWEAGVRGVGNGGEREGRRRKRIASGNTPKDEDDGQKSSFFGLLAQIT
jgi:hypothetical protein